MIHGGNGMIKKRNIIKWSIVLLGIVIAGVLWGMGNFTKPPQAEVISEPPTNTGEDLKKALLSLKPVLVDFGSNKCIPCRQLRPILREIEKEYKGKAHVLIIDVFELRDLAREHRIQLIPTLVFFDRSGKEVFRPSGTWDKNSMIQKLRKAGMN